jgi:DNA-binding SARP family transcriptional activator
MGTLDIVDRLYQSFVEQTKNKSVVLIHAESKYRIPLISRIFSDDITPTFYYEMNIADIDIPSFLANFTHDLAEQVSTFGTHINQIGFSTLDIPSILHALVQDLNALSEHPYILIIDECDRATIGDDLQYFLELIIDSLPKHVKIIFSGRATPRFPWLALCAQNKAIILKDEVITPPLFYSQQSPEKAQVQVSAFGPGNVFLNNELIENWEGHLPRLLLFFVLERPHVTRSEICESFWPELTSDQAVNVFHVTKRRLHKALEILGVDILIHEENCYYINPKVNIYYDVVDFVHTLFEARKTNGLEKKAAHWQRVIEMHKRSFLQGHPDHWITRRQQEYQIGLVEALVGMAQLRYEHQRPEQALALLQQAAKQSLTEQSSHRQLMLLYGELGRRSEAVAHYQQLDDRLKSLGLVCDEETQTVYHKLMKD